MDQQPYLYFRATVGTGRSVIASGYQPFEDLQAQVAWAVAEVRKELAPGEEIASLDRYTFGTDDATGHWDEITTAHRLRRGRSVLIDGEWVVLGYWKGQGDGRAILADVKHAERGIFTRDQAFVLRPDRAAQARFAAYEKAEQEARDRAEQEVAEADAAAEMRNERWFEDRGYEDARAQERWEAEHGITR